VKLLGSKSGLLSPLLTGRGERLRGAGPPRGAAPVADPPIGDLPVVGAPSADAHAADEPELSPAARWLPRALAEAPATHGERRPSMLPAAVNTAPKRTGSPWLVEDEQPAAPAESSAPGSLEQLSSPAPVPPPRAEPGANRSRWAGADSSSVPSFAEADRERYQRAVHAYCRELCDRASVERATDEVLTHVDWVSNGATAPSEDLRRLARSVAAEHFSTSPARQQLVATGGSECATMPARLAARAGDGPGPLSQGQLQSHLAGCLHCQAVELKMSRAERAFTTTLAAGTRAQAAAEDAEPPAGLETAEGLADSANVWAPPAPVAPVAVSAAPVATSSMPWAAGTAPAAGGPSAPRRAAPTGATPRRRRLRQVPGRLLLAAGAGALIVAIVAVALVLSSGGGPPNTTPVQPSSNPATPTSGESAARSSKRSGRTAARRHRRRRTVRHRAAASALAPPTTAARSAAPPGTGSVTPIPSSPPSPSTPSSPAPPSPSSPSTPHVKVTPPTNPVSGLPGRTQTNGSGGSSGGGP